jgi:hypothetical protein
MWCIDLQPERYNLLQNDNLEHNLSSVTDSLLLRVPVTFFAILYRKVVSTSFQGIKFVYLYTMGCTLTTLMTSL